MKPYLGIKLMERKEGIPVEKNATLLAYYDNIIAVNLSASVRLHQGRRCRYIMLWR
jgi:hypothetical protein